MALPSLTSARLFPIPLPILIAIALPIVIGGHTSGGTGVVWGLIPALTTGVVPHLLDRRAKRRPQSSGPGSTRSKGQIAATVASLVLGLVVVVMGHAPQPVVACAAVLFALLVVIDPIQRFWDWDISIHSATAGAAASMCFIIWGPLVGFFAYGLTAVVARSRVLVHRRTGGAKGHMPLEAISGALLGAALGGSIYVLLN